MNSFDPNDPNLALSPLADPVTSAIFANAEVAGLASESLIKATLKAENENPLLGKIISVTPQRSHSSPKRRGCRVDVDTETDAKIRQRRYFGTNGGENAKGNLYKPTRLYPAKVKHRFSSAVQGYVHKTTTRSGGTKLRRI